MTTTQSSKPRKAKIENDSADHVYFTTTPRIVWALARTPYDLTLWQTIKDIAGDNGECYISTPDLAVLAMMSVGQCSDSRSYLLKCGLLKGMVRKDPGFPLAVWHLSVPDLWGKSTAWSEQYKSINSRLQFKAQQKNELAQERKKARASKNASHSPGELSDLSPGEKPHSPGEKPHSPGETKNIKQEDQKEEHLGAAAPAQPVKPKKRGDIMDGILFYQRLAEEKQNQLADRVNAYPPDVQEALLWFVDVYGLLPSAIPAKPARGGKGGDYALWINELREIIGVLEGFGRSGIEATRHPCANLSVSHPGAIMWCLPAEIGKLAARTLEDKERQSTAPANDWKKGLKLYA